MAGRAGLVYKSGAWRSAASSGYALSPSTATPNAAGQIARFRESGSILDQRGNTYMIKTGPGTGLGLIEMSVSRAQAKRGGIPGGTFLRNTGDRTIYTIKNTRAAIKAARKSGATLPKDFRAYYFVKQR